AAWGAAPVIPFEPPPTVTPPRSPLCIVGASVGSRAPAQRSLTSTGHAGSGGGNPMSTTSSLPHHSRARRCPRRAPPHVIGSVARTGPRASPLERSTPRGTRPVRPPAQAGPPRRPPRAPGGPPAGGEPWGQREHLAPRRPCRAGA